MVSPTIAECFCTIGLFSYKWLIDASDEHLQFYGGDDSDRSCFL